MQETVSAENENGGNQHRYHFGTDNEHNLQ